MSPGNDISAGEEGRMLTTVRDLGAAVRHRRREVRLSQATLAGRAGVSRQWLSAFESGKTPAAELGRVLDVLSALGLAIDLVTATSSDAGAGLDPFAGFFGEPS
jgi:HTH-type transcriptional regulator/antitoxin HipB